MVQLSVSIQIYVDDGADTAALAADGRDLFTRIASCGPSPPGEGHAPTQTNRCSWARPFMKFFIMARARGKGERDALQPYLAGTGNAEAADKARDVNESASQTREPDWRSSPGLPQGRLEKTGTCTGRVLPTSSPARSDRVQIGFLTSFRPGIAWSSPAG